MQKLVFINGAGNQIDLTSGNFGITNWAGLSNTSLNIQTQQVPFEDGGVFLDALMEQREIEITVAIYDGNNLELRYQKKRELISALNPKLGEGTLIYTNDYLSRQIKAVPQIPLFENKNSNDAGTLKASVAFSCPSPYWEDIEETVIQFTSSQFPKVQNNGDIKTQLTLDLLGSKNNTVIKNLVNKKQIVLNGTESKPLYISTELGSKKIYNENADYTFLKTWYTYDSFCYAENPFYYYCIMQDKIMKSLDCVKWEVITTIDYSIYKNFTKIIYFNNKLFLLGENGLILKSEDGKNFAQIATGLTSEKIVDGIYAEDNYLFLAENDYILKSSDLQNWEVVTIPSGQNRLLFYNNGIYVISTPFYCYYGNDLTNWSSTSDTRYIVSSVANGYFFSKTYKSLDLQNWSSLNIEARTPVKYIKGMYYTSGVVNNGSSYKHLIYTSTNAESWNEKEMPYNVIGIYYYNNLISVIIGWYTTKQDFLQGETIDNLTYLQKHGLHTITGINTDIKRNKYICVTDDGYCGESSDLLNWTFRAVCENDNFSFIKYIKETGVYIIGNHYTTTTHIPSRIYISYDFVNWEYVDVGSYGTEDIIYIEDWKKYILADDNANVCVSDDLHNWNYHKLGMYGETKSVVYNKIIGIAIAIGTQYSGYSYDGVNWSSLEMYDRSCASSNTQGLVLSLKPLYNGTTDIYIIQDKITINHYNINYYLLDLIFVEELQLFVGVGEGVFAISSDGLNWQFTELEIPITYNCLTYSLFNNALVIYALGSSDGTSANDILEISFIKSENKIASLTSNSDLTFCLEVGENQIVVENTGKKIYCILKYRQKYIGV